MKLRILLLLFCFLAASLASGAGPKTDTLIVPGQSIGIIKIGERTDKAYARYGDEDFGDMAMGKGDSIWYLGAKKGDKGRQFRRPDEIGLWMHRDEEGHHYLITQAQVTSPKFATAEGIAPGSSLTAINAQYPDLKIFESDPSVVKSWQPFGEVRIYSDAKRGIAFAIRKSDDICVEIIVMEPGGDGGVRNPQPAACWDYDMNSFEGSVGDAKLGMTAPALTKLLGEPDDKRRVAYGWLWRWRLPSQTKDEIPAFCIYFTELPDRTLVAGQIRVTSPMFHLQPTLFPGCPLAALWNENWRSPQWIDEFTPQKGGKIVDIYGDLVGGVLFEVNRDEGVCSAITLTSPAIDILQSVAAHAQLPVDSKGASPAPTKP